MIYTHILLSLTLAHGSLTVGQDSNPESEYPVFVAVSGSGWLHDSDSNFVPAGYYELMGEDAEEVVFQAQQVGLLEGQSALRCIADVLIELCEVAVDTSGISELTDPFPAYDPVYCPVCGAGMVMDYDGGEMVCSSDECDARQAIERDA